MEESEKVKMSRNTFRKICDNLPYNKNRVYCEIFLEDSRCKLYIPVRDNLVHNASAAKNFWEKLAKAANL